jgi:hypothetical protein
VCDHLHDATSRYDPATKLMTCLVVCRACRTEQVTETLEYEPRPVWLEMQANDRKRTR